MTLKRSVGRLAAVLVAFMLIVAACGGDDSGDDAASNDTSGESDVATTAGGDFVDLGTFVGDPPEHIDPALNSTLDAYQVVNPLYDGLTDIDASDPDNPVIVPDVAESYEANEDASVWTFTIREGEQFSTGEPVLPSSFTRAWNRAAQPDFAGDYSYLIGSFIEGGQAVLDGEADEISGVVADDDAMTLEVTLTEPYANFDAVAGFQLFMPMPSEVDDLANQNDWENGIMIGNGPYIMSAPRTDQEIALAKNPEYDGDYNGDTWDDRLDTITFRVSADPDTSYNSFEAGEGDNANIPPARTAEADQNYGTTLDVPILGSYHYVFNFRDPRVGGDENLLFRQAISQAIDREEINAAVYDGSRTTSTGITPEGIPGSGPGHLRLLRLRPGCGPGRLRRVGSGGQQPGRAAAHPVQLRCRSRAGRADHHRQPRRHRHRGRGRSDATPRPTSRIWRTGTASSAGSVGSPTTRRTTTSCSTCSTRPLWTATTTASPTTSSMRSSRRRSRPSTPTSRPPCSSRPKTSC